MRLNKFLKERFEIGFKIYGEYYEIFSNPTSKEFKEVVYDEAGQKVIRFIANKRNKRVYIFHQQGYTHPEAWNELKKQNIEKGSSYLSESKKGNLLGGYGMLKGGKCVLFSSEPIDYDPWDYTKIIKGNWSWVDKYIFVTDYIEKLRLRLKL